MNLNDPIKKLDEEIAKALSAPDELELRQIMQESQAELFPAETKRSRRRRLPYGVAAGVLALAVASVVLWSLFMQGGGDLYGEYYEGYALYSIERSEGAAEEWKEVAKLYQEGDFTGFLGKVDALPVNDKINAAALDFYRGMASMELKAFADAEVEFRKVLAEGDNLFLVQARWYLSLTLVGQEKFEEAKVELARISLDDGKFGEMAAQLLEEM